MTKIAFDNHIKKHKTLGCLAPSCPDQFNEFQAFCKHVNTCKPSWKEIVTSFVQFECFACSKSYKLYQVKFIQGVQDQNFRIQTAITQELCA